MLLVPLKHIEKGDFGSHDFEIRAYSRPRGRGGFRGGPGGCAALLRNVFFGVILTQNLTRPFPGCFPPKNTRKLPRVFNPRKSEKSGPKSVTPKMTIFWPFLALFWPFLDPPPGPPRTPQKPPFLAKKGPFLGFLAKNTQYTKTP